MNSYQFPVPRSLNMERSALHDLRRYAVRHWERELHLPPHLVLLLAGHSFAVREAYHNAPNPAEIVAMYADFAPNFDKSLTAEK